MSERFTREQIETIARLARVDLAPGEQELFARQLADIVAYVTTLQDVETSGVPPTSHALVTEMPMRDDEVRESLPRDAAMAAAPLAAAGLFKVPRVLG